MSEHTPGPWSVHVEEDNGFQNISIEEIHRCLYDTEWADPEDFERDLANACRIAACVNACEGMDDPETEMKQLQAENARLREALERVVAWGNERNFDTTCESGKMLIKARAALGKED
jgi:hypothetical protein